MNGNAHIHFSDEKPMAEVDSAMYLGSEINKEAGRLSELNKRINNALATCNKRKTFWSKLSAHINGSCRFTTLSLYRDLHMD